MGGYSRVILSLLPYLKGNIHLLGIKIVNKDLLNLNIDLHGIRFHTIFNVKYPSNIPLRLKTLYGYWDSRKKIKNMKFDLLYVHTSESALPFLFRKDMPPVIFHQHGSSNPLANSDYPWARNQLAKLLFEMILKAVYLKSRAILSIDKQCYKRSQKYGVESKTYLINNPVDTKTFYLDFDRRIKKTKNFGFSSQYKIIVFSGRLSKVKNIDILLDTMKLADSLNKKWILLIAGDGPMRNFLKDKANEIEIEKKVFFLGSIPYLRMPEIYNVADAVVLPSSNEGVPMSLLEALACGTPVVATRVGGIPEFVKQNQNGILLDKPSKECVYRGLENCFQNEWNARRIAYSVSSYSGLKVAESLYTIFKKVVYNTRDKNS